MNVLTIRLGRESVVLGEDLVSPRTYVSAYFPCQHGEKVVLDEPMEEHILHFHFVGLVLSSKQKRWLEKAKAHGIVESWTLAQEAVPVAAPQRMLMIPVDVLSALLPAAASFYKLALAARAEHRPYALSEHELIKLHIAVDSMARELGVQDQPLYKDIVRRDR